MIYGKIKDMQLYRDLYKGFDKAIDYINQFDINTPCGRYEIDGDDVFANVSDVVELKSIDNIFEAHREYIDIQVVFSGNEKLNISYIDDCSIYKKYDEKKDIALFVGKGNLMDISAEEFYILYPFDCHAVYLNSEYVKKVVIKVKYREEENNAYNI